MKALVDTNFLMIPGDFKVDILTELLNLGYSEIFTVDLVVKELEKLSVADNTRRARSARIAMVCLIDCFPSCRTCRGWS